MTRNRSAVLLVPSLSLLAAGCLGYGPYFGSPFPPAEAYGVAPPSTPADLYRIQSHAPPPPVSRGPPSPAEPKVAMGVSVGFMMSEGIGPGADLVATIWLNEIVGVRLSGGYYSLDRGYDDGNTRVVPLLVRAVFATPLGEGSSYRSQWGLGMGLFSVDRSYPYWGYGGRHDEYLVYFVEAGREYLLQGNSRLFTQMGFYIGAETAALSFKMGFDFGG